MDGLFPRTKPMLASNQVMNKVKTITRKDLIAQGGSRYLVRLITFSLHPVEVCGQRNVYHLNQVISAIRHHQNHPGTKPQTKQALDALLSNLVQRLDNVVMAPFGKSVDERIGFHINRVLGKSNDH